MRFYTGTSFPAEYRNNIFIASTARGTARRKSATASRAVVVEGGRVLKHEVFAEGWLQGESVWGRPVDIEVMPTDRYSCRTITRERFTASRTAGGSVLQKLLALLNVSSSAGPVNKVW